MDFLSYKYEFIDRAEEGTDKPLEHWFQLVRLLGDAIEEYWGFKVAYCFETVQKEKSPFEFFSLHNDQLYLFSIDVDAMVRDDEKIGLSELNTFLTPTMTFMQAAIHADDALLLGDSTKATIAATLKALNNGEKVEGIKSVHIVGLCLNELLHPRSQSPFFKIENLDCCSSIVSLHDLWEKGIEIPTVAGDIVVTPVGGTARVVTDEDQEPQTVTETVPVDSEVRNETVSEEGAVVHRPEQAGAVTEISTAELYDADSPEAFVKGIIAEAKASDRLTVYAMFDLTAQLLVESDKYEEIFPVYCDTHLGNQTIKIDGYAYDETINVLTLFVLDYDVRADLSENLTKTAADSIFRHAENFFNHSVTSRIFDAVDASSEAGGLAHTISQMARSSDTPVTRIEFVIISLHKRSRTLRTEDCVRNGVTFRHQVISVDELYEMSQKENAVEIKFSPPIRLLPAIEDQKCGYSSYVGVIPGKMLAEIYSEYGQRVLTSNVRAFLMTKNKVNAGIQKTIREEGSRFFAYNNGICVVCDSITKDLRSGVTLVTGASDFQIVNGGQTTASLLHAKTKGIPLDDISVPIKLSVVADTYDSSEKQVFVQKISEYANSQSKVNASDLGANSQFQIRFDKAGQSGECLATNNGASFRWYYERTRGSYKVERSRYKKRKDFDRMFPKHFSKTDLAKWLKSWSGEPFISSHGAQFCYTDFAKDLKVKEQDDPELSFCTPEYFKHCVAKGILFKQIDSWVAASQWYKNSRSYKINIVCYTMGLLSHVIQKTYGKDKDLNFRRIWREQNISLDLYGLLDRMAQFVRSILNDPRRLNDDVGEWVKKAACWDMMTKRGYTLTREEKQLLESYVTQRRDYFDIPSHRDTDKKVIVAK